jgi:hypothetical protein
MSKKLRSTSGGTLLTRIALTSKTTLTIALAGATALTSFLYGCAFMDKNPPIIQGYKIPEWSVEEENVDVELNTFDNNGVKEAYVQLNNDLRIPLSKVSSSKEKGEKAGWKGSYKIPVGDYEYIVVVVDRAGNKSDPKGSEGKISAYPFDADKDGIGYRDEVKYGLEPNNPEPVAKYILSRNAGFLIPALKFMDESAVMDENTKNVIDWTAPL